MPETFILIPGRTSDQGCGISEGKFQEKYQTEINTLQVAPGDMERLGLAKGDRVRLTSELGPGSGSGRHAGEERRAARGPLVHRLRRHLQPPHGRRHARLRHADEQRDGCAVGSSPAMSIDREHSAKYAMTVFNVARRCSHDSIAVIVLRACVIVECAVYSHVNQTYRESVHGNSARWALSRFGRAHAY